MQFNEEFFVAAATVIFFAATFKPMKKALLGMLDGKINKIRKDLNEAARLKNEASKLLAEAQARLVETENHAKDIINHAQKEADLLVRNTRTKLETDIETRKKLAMQKIQSFEENAINELRKNISSITVSAAAQIIEESSDEDSFKKLVGTSLEKLSKTIH
jgi:F-type H+-transporting ATPase subunit b